MQERYLESQTALLALTAMCRLITIPLPPPGRSRMVELRKRKRIVNEKPFIMMMAQYLDMPVDNLRLQLNQILDKLNKLPHNKNYKVPLNTFKKHPQINGMVLFVREQLGDFL